MTAYHTNRCFSFLMLPKIVEKLIIDYKAVRLSTSTKVSPQLRARALPSSKVNCKKGWAWLFQFDHSYAIIIATRN